MDWYCNEPALQLKKISLKKIHFLTKHSCKTSNFHMIVSALALVTLVLVPALSPGICNKKYFNAI